ncbi:MAG: PAS domain S-box protein [Melioribacteraceae bacterium]|nr:PAS domain S-box protein [Melioribacteraceae bacterium]MCF8353763.1 PAS domain S-box protein [Melioribacteraceae bacterium]MCF8392427.1 PAS domain S-box protein [Melioribacteraceae bacterium]MCF8418339.1 PAS domain S-box protein [Melioribacteraceae bacterium]
MSKPKANKSRMDDALNSALELKSRLDSALIDDIITVGLEACEKITSSMFSFLYFVDRDATSKKIIIWSEFSKTNFEHIQSSAQMLKEINILNDSIEHAKPILDNKINSELTVNNKPAGKNYLTRALSVPIFEDGKIAAVIVVGNKESDYDDLDTRIIQLLGNAIWLSYRKKNVEIYSAKNENKFLQMFQSSPDSIVLNRFKDGTIIEVNDNFTKLWGYTSSEVLDNTFTRLKFFHDENIHDELINKLKLGQRIENFETELIMKNGSLRIGLISVNIIYIGDEKAAIWIIRDITDSMEYQFKLEENEKRFNLVQKAVGFGLWDWNLITGEIIWDWRSFQLLGYKSTFELNFEKWKSLINKDDFNQVYPAISNSLITGEPFSVEIRLKTANNSWKWMRCRGKTVQKNSEGKSVRMLGTYIDITKDKAAEFQILERKKQFEDIVNTTDGIVWELDVETFQFTFVSKKAEEILGYNIDEWYKKNFWSDHLYYEDKDYVISFYSRSIRKKTDYQLEYRFIKKNGSVLWLRDIVSVVIQNDKPVLLRGIMIDITPEKKAEQALIESEERYKRLVEESPFIVYIYSLTKGFLFCSKKAIEIFGYDPQKTTGKFMWSDEVHPDDKSLLESAHQKTKLGEFYEIEYRVKDKNAKWHWLNDRIINIRYEKNEIIIEGIAADITEKHFSQKELEESQERYSTFIEQTTEGIYRLEFENPIDLSMPIDDQVEYYHENAVLAECNKVFMRMYGIEKRKDIIGQYLKDFQGGDVDVNKSSIKSFIENGFKIQDIITIEQNTEDRIIYINNNAVGIEKDGFLLRVWGTQQDVTEKYLTEKHLLKLSKAVEQSQVSIMITDVNGKIEYVNPKFCEVSGYSTEEIIGKYSSILKSNKMDATFYKDLWDTLKSGNVWQGQFCNMKKNGELFWESANISPIKDEQNRITHFVAVKEDITEKIKAEEELNHYRENLENLVKERTNQLEKQNQFLKVFFDNIPNPVFIKDKNGKFTDINKEFEVYFEVKKDEVIGKKVNVFTQAEAAEISMKKDELLIQYNTKTVYENFHIKKNGNKRDILIYKSSFGKDENNPDGIIGLVIDITDQKEFEDLTVKALNKERQLNRMKSNFISMASHEFRTPLTSILASTDLLEMYGRTWDENKYQIHIKKIQRSVQKITSLIEDVLLLSKSETGKLKVNVSEINLKKFFTELIEHHRPALKKNQSITLNFELVEDKAKCDRKLFENIFNNLLSNAIKFSDEGKEIQLNCIENNDQIIVDVIDQGIGLSEEELPNVFDTFFRASKVSHIPGSGLGLSIAKEAIDLLGAKIYVESEENKGTKFRLLIDKEKLLG